MSTRQSLSSAAICLLVVSVSLAQPGIQWVRIYPDTVREFGGAGFADFYITSQRDFALCGDHPTDSSMAQWLMLTDREGRVRFESFIHGSNSGQAFRSVIETDNGDILTAGYEGGHGGGDYSVLRTTVDGDEVWHRYLGTEGKDICDAVIELKDGDFLLAGWTYTFDPYRGDAYLIKITGNGEVIWDRHYGVQREGDLFHALREVEGGYLLAGMRNWTAWLLKVNENGDEIWSHTYSRGGDQRSTEWFGTLISVRDGGFLAAGTSIVNENQLSLMLVDRVDANGGIIWQRTYELQGEGRRRIVHCAANAPDGGFVLVGELVTGNSYGVILRINADGNPMWDRIFEHDGRPVGASVFRSVLIDEDGGIIVAGDGSTARVRSGALLLKLAPERSAPEIIEFSPESLGLSVLPNDSILFHIRAIDAQDDSISYFWLLARDTAAYDSNTTITFSELGDFIVTGIAFDGELADSVAWLVHVRDLFVVSHIPDTLNLSLRRGSSVDFGIEVAAVEGDPVNYQWTLDNPDNPQPEVVSDDSLATIEFLRSGNYALEAFAGRGESFDAVTWTISVRSAIWSFWPGQLSLTVPPDTVVNFGVIPFNLESDSLSYAWYFGEDLLGMDSTVDVQFGGEGRVEVTAIVTDGAEVDTLLWDILVQPPDAVESNFLFPLSSFALSASPNPFNANTTVSYDLPAAAEIRLTLHDIGGRRVRVLADGLRLAGRHSALLDGSGLPAGVYLIRLEAGSNVRMMKAVVVK